MNRATSFLLRAWLAALVALVSTATVQAGDFYRQMGMGYSAGYHAPAPFARSQTCAKLPGWMHWKGACSHPGTTAQGCGCANDCGCGTGCGAQWVAPPCGGCGPKYSGYRLPGACTSCGTRNALAY